MKTKIIILSAIIALFSVTVASTKTGKGNKAISKKNSSTESRVGKGISLEDRNQFN